MGSNTPNMENEEKPKMALTMEKQELTKVYNKQNESWKLVKKDQSYVEQLSTIEETLSRFGLLKNEIKVYLHLARSGEMKAGEIAEAISLHRTETYRILRDLEKRGVVFSVFEKPLKFTAVPLDKAIDLLVDAQKIKIKLLEQEKTSLVELWQSMPQLKVANVKKELFQMLEGEQQVIMKANELLEKTEKTFQIFASADYLAQLYYSDFSDKLKKQADKVNVTLITDNSLKSSYFIGQLQWLSESQRIVDKQNLPCFMISDDKEVLIGFHEDAANDEDAKKKYKTAAIWTNYSAFIKILQMLFSKLT
ncbi:MAG TPA: helix-turn-helix domain-containing protein [Verrucomicrobiae bacterium]|nr:helix-turn-helix domain-containing protein [Verrucomicrobiae bacterium]